MHVGVIALAASTDVDATLVVLHLLLRFKSLLAFNGRTLEFVLVLHRKIVGVHLLGRFKHREPNLARLYQALDTTLVTEVGATKFETPLAVCDRLGARALVLGITEANEKGLSGQNGGPVLPSRISGI